MFVRFLLVGSLGFVIDSALTLVLINLSFDASLARIPGIVAAMLITWLANRHFSFRVTNPVSFSEPLRYALVATVMSVLNYLVYLLFITFDVWPLLAIASATACQAIVSYHAYHSYVFKHSRR